MKSPLITRLNIAELFGALTPEERLYAHHLSQAAWAGTRIILRQVSPGSPLIFDLIRKLYSACKGVWNVLINQPSVSTIPRDESEGHLQEFLRYAAAFLSNMGNYYGEGDQKFSPEVPELFLYSISAITPAALSLCRQCASAICAIKPNHLGYPSDTAQSSYYIGESQITKAESDDVTSFLDETDLRLRNTRLSKDFDKDSIQVTFSVLQASIEFDDRPKLLGHLENGSPVRLTKGDHSLELRNIYSHLQAAQKLAQDPLRVKFLHGYQDFFRTGDMSLYDDSQHVWMKDKQLHVETFFGFNHKYQDPVGARAEFQGFAGLLDAESSKELNALQNDAQVYIATLPWVDGFQGKGGVNGPFEMEEFQVPDFNAISALSYAATNIFTGLSLPGLCDNREDYSWKNIMVKNRDEALKPGELSQGEPAWFISESERTTYLQHIDQSVRFKVALHEIFGHGTGKLLSESDSGQTNFDTSEPPIDPLTMLPITSWYKDGKSTVSVFGDMDMSLEECRAEAIAAYLAFNQGILSTMGFSNAIAITADDNSYQPEEKEWTSAHDRAYFAILRTLIAADDFMTVVYNDKVLQSSVTVSINRDRLLSTARPAIAALMTKLHVWRCCGDGPAAVKFYGNLTEVDDYWLLIREVVVNKVKDQVPRLFVQANTFLEDGVVRVVEYDTTVEGVIQSWCEKV